jgi:hypothetical protein
MGVKTVILKSTLWWFWWFWVTWGVSDDRVFRADWSHIAAGRRLLYMCNDIVAGVLPYIRMAGDALRVSCPLADLLAVGLARGLVLF